MSKTKDKKARDEVAIEAALRELFESYWDVLQEWLDRGSAICISRGKDKLYVSERLRAAIVIDLY